MAIKGLTDKRRVKPSFYSAVLHNGGRKNSKSKRKFGDDLKNYFRLELRDPNLKYTLKEMGIPPLKSSQLTTKDGIVNPTANEDDYLVETLDIFLASDDPEKAFKTSMQLWDHSGLLQDCDRQTILSKRENYTDIFGHNRTRMKETNQACPMADQDVSVPCTKGCQRSGTLEFYVPQFVDTGGTSKSCKLDVSGFYHFCSILESLEKIKEEFGSILSAPEEYPCYRGIIPLILKRIKIPIKRPVFEQNVTVTQAGKKVPKRSGKKANSHAWVVTLEVNPIWKQGYYAWLQHKQIKKLGYSPSVELIRQIPGVDSTIDVTSTVVEDPKMLPQSCLGDSQWQELRQIWNSGDRHDSWQSEREFVDEIRKFYGIPLEQVSVSEFPRIVEHLKHRSLGDPDQF